MSKINKKSLLYDMIYCTTILTNCTSSLHKILGDIIQSLMMLNSEWNSCPSCKTKVPYSAKLCAQCGHTFKLCRTCSRNNCLKHRFEDLRFGISGIIVLLILLQILPDTLFINILLVIGLLIFLIFPLIK